jgi:hypothetical protein
LHILIYNKPQWEGRKYTLSLMQSTKIRGKSDKGGKGTGKMVATAASL